LPKEVLKRLCLENRQPDLEPWKELVEKVKNTTHSVQIAIVGKYTKLSDAYISVVESLKHAGFALGANIDFKWLSAEDCENKDLVTNTLKEVQGVVVPGGFGIRGIEGKVNVIQYCRENNLPFLGLCLGMQCAVIEFARNVVGLDNANSTEFDDKTPFPVIDFMEEQRNIEEFGGTMRLGQYECHLQPGSKAQKAYNSEVVMERHRHRYEVNNQYREKLSKAGLVLSGLSPDKSLVEIVELPELDWFVACQFHPEFKSWPEKRHPLFFGLVQTASKRILVKNKVTV